MRGLTAAGLVALATVGLITACDREIVSPLRPNGCTPALPIAPVTSTPLAVLGRGAMNARYTAEVDARGSVAYTTTWGNRGAVGNAIFIWNVAGNTPVLIDSVIVSGATTLGDIAVSDDGALLVVATERSGGSMVVFDLSNPVSPVQLSRFATGETNPGVHTAEIGRVDGKLHAFLSINPQSTPVAAAREIIVDLTVPTAPRQVYSRAIGSPYVHDVFVRDGILFLATWNTGLQIWDLGGAGNGSPASPRVIGSVATVGGSAHNVWWYHDPASGSRAYAFVGEEGPSGGGGIGVSSSGDVHVIDVCDMANPVEVAFFHVPGAGSHNFSMDESRGILYAAFYNGGVRAIDVRGDLGKCTIQQRSPDGRCDLALMGREVASGVKDVPGRYIWGVVYRAGAVYLSDMNNGLWKLKGVGAP